MSRILLLGLLVEAFVAEGDPLGMGIEEALERHWGKKISARGLYRDPVRATHETFVNSSVLLDGYARCCWWKFPGLRGFGPGPFRALCRCARRRTHKKMTQWPWQQLLFVRRCYP